MTHRPVSGGRPALAEHRSADHTAKASCCKLTADSFTTSGRGSTLLTVGTLGERRNAPQQHDPELGPPVFIRAVHPERRDGLRAGFGQFVLANPNPDISTPTTPSQQPSHPTVGLPSTTRPGVQRDQPSTLSNRRAFAQSVTVAAMSPRLAYAPGVKRTPGVQGQDAAAKLTGSQSAVGSVVMS